MNSEPPATCSSEAVPVRGFNRHMELKALAKQREQQQKEREDKVFKRQPKVGGGAGCQGNTALLALACCACLLCAARKQHVMRCCGRSSDIDGARDVKHIAPPPCPRCRWVSAAAMYSCSHPRRCLPPPPAQGNPSLFTIPQPFNLKLEEVRRARAAEGRAAAQQQQALARQHSECTFQPRTGAQEKRQLLRHILAEQEEEEY